MSRHDVVFENDHSVQVIKIKQRKEGRTMNLIHLFHQTIVEIGMKTLESSVFYTAPVGLRFEIGGEEDVYVKKGIRRKEHPNPDYVNKAVERALTIFHALPKEDWILRIDLYDEKVVKKGLKVLQLSPPHEKVLNIYEVDGEEEIRYELYWSLNDVDWSEETIFREIILADIGGLTCLASAVYLLHPYEKILFHLYDDRGLDVVAKEKRSLYPLYETFNEWILEYDRESIDHTFKHKHEKFELGNFIDFLNKLEEKNIYYQLNRVRNDAIMVEVVIPGQRWEVEYLVDGTIEVEKFLSDKGYYDESELEVLFRDFSD